MQLLTSIQLSLYQICINQQWNHNLLGHVWCFW